MRRALRTHLTDLKRLTYIFPNLVIVFVNQVKERLDVFYGNPLIHLGGDVIAHASTNRVFLRKGKGEQRIAKIVKSPYLSVNKADFSILESGISD